MTDQWQELKETITEMRDNDGTGTQQEVCKFLVNYMDILEKQMQTPCEDEYIKVPKKALKYRTAGMVAYNAEWLKNNFDIERAVICGAQEPCKDTISREDALMCLTGEIKETDTIETIIARSGRRIKSLPSVKPQEPCEDADMKLIHTQGLDEGIKCAMCTNSMANDKGCDGGCVVNEVMYKKILDVIRRHIIDGDEL